jgi:hypothetical protein
MARKRKVVAQVAQEVTIENLEVVEVPTPVIELVKVKAYKCFECGNVNESPKCSRCGGHLSKEV